MKWHTLSGSQATALTAFLPRLLRVRLSFLALTSHTVTKPPLLPVTMICGTFLFQSKHSISSARAAVLPNLNGFETLLRSEMKSYISVSFSERRYRAMLVSVPRLLLQRSPVVPI